MTNIPSVAEQREEILTWMHAYIPRGKTIPVFEDMLEQYAAADRLALLTELRNSEMLEETYVKEADSQFTIDQKLGYNTLARKIKAHLDELIKTNGV